MRDTNHQNLTELVALYYLGDRRFRSYGVALSTAEMQDLDYMIELSEVPRFKRTVQRGRKIRNRGRTEPASSVT